MIASSSHQTWLFYSPLAQQAALLKDDLLDPVDLLLDDPALVDLVRQCLAKRSPRSTRTGRRGMAPDRLLRCCVMKHLKGWSFAIWNGNCAATWCTAASPSSMPRSLPSSLSSAAALPCSVRPSPPRFISAWSAWP